MKLNVKHSISQSDLCLHVDFSVDYLFYFSVTNNADYLQQIIILKSVLQ